MLKVILSVFSLWFCNPEVPVGSAPVNVVSCEYSIENHAKSIIMEREGLRLFPYKCSAGVQTIGYGHTGFYSNVGIIDSSFAEELLDMDFESCLQESERMIGRRNHGLALFLYGVGSTKFNGSKLHKDLLAGRDPLESWLSWCIIPGRSVSDVKKMRLAEYNLYKISDGRH